MREFIKETGEWALVGVVTILALTGLVVWVMAGVRLAGGSAERFGRALDAAEECPASSTPVMPHYRAPTLRDARL